MRMLFTGYALTVAMACTGTLATAQPNIAARAQTSPGNEQLAHVLCVTQTPGFLPVVPMHPSKRTRWVLIDPAVNYEFGKKSDFDHEPDPRHRLWVSIQPLVGAKSTSLTIETDTHQTFWLHMVDDPSQAVSMVIILKTDPETGEPIPDDRCKKRESAPADGNSNLTVALAGEHFDTHPPKSARFESGGYIMEGRITEQHRLGDTLTCRYRVINEGLPYAAKEAQILPLNSDEPLDAIVTIDGKSFPLLLGHENALTGVIHVRSDASQLARGFKLRFLPDGIGIPAVMGFDEEPENVGRLSIQAQGLGGTIILKNSANPSQTDFTTMLGAGARVLYGVTKHTSVDVAVSALSTQEAKFDDLSTADATVFRVLTGGVLQFGEKTVPYLRAGIGAHVTSYTHSMDDDSKLSGGILVYGGVGVDRWLREDLVLGIAATFVGPNAGGDDQITMFEAGVHFGYAWKP